MDMEEKKKTTGESKATTSTVGTIVRGMYQRTGGEWHRVPMAAKRWKGGELLPDRIQIERAVIYPVDDERYPVSITMGALPWNCGGGHFRHLLCGPEKPQLGTLMMHRTGPDEREVLLITRASAYRNEVRSMARFTASLVTGDPDVEAKLLREVYGEQWEWMPQSEDLPQLHTNLD